MNTLFLAVTMLFAFASIAFPNLLGLVIFLSLIAFGDQIAGALKSHAMAMKEIAENKTTDA